MCRPPVALKIYIWTYLYGKQVCKLRHTKTRLYVPFRQIALVHLSISLPELYVWNEERGAVVGHLLVFCLTIQQSCPSDKL
jgi:hypothetical protein